MEFASETIENVTAIFSKGVKEIIRDAVRFSEIYKQPKERWEKLSGITNIAYNGVKSRVEINWYEANGQRELIKVKRVIKNEG